MLTKKSLGDLRVIFVSKLREVYCNIIFNVLVHIKSKSLTVSKKSAIVFAPHPDDETFGCGGIIALKCAQGTPVKVVFITDGRQSRPDWIKPEEIIKTRQNEAVIALENLGLPPSAIHFMGHTDGTLNQLSGEKRQQIIRQLAELLKSSSSEEVYVPHHQDSHLDHEASYNLVKEAIVASGIQVEIFQYPIWILWQNPLSSHLNLQEFSPSYRIFIGDVQDQKNQAIASYKSQITTLPLGFLKRFSSPYEIFVKS